MSNHANWTQNANENASHVARMSRRREASAKTDCDTQSKKRQNSKGNQTKSTKPHILWFEWAWVTRLVMLLVLRVKWIIYTMFAKWSEYMGDWCVRGEVERTANYNIKYVNEQFYVDGSLVQHKSEQLIRKAIWTGYSKR